MTIRLRFRIAAFGAAAAAGALLLTACSPPRHRARAG
ncbi:hypothetical protein HEB29_005693 [Streptomyces fulvorobeus]|uniref:Lipoprotein n=1 Tax=Streptomyces fulvorobeus TaxID=284028 RepID=A0A7Y9L050_9ACTN|nr:hypothetical protein [Streptomyces fulvorobeus]